LLVLVLLQCTANKQQHPTAKQQQHYQGTIFKRIGSTSTKDYDF
jgi:hypothetical protein